MKIWYLKYNLMSYEQLLDVCTRMALKLKIEKNRKRVSDLADEYIYAFKRLIDKCDNPAFLEELGCRMKAVKLEKES